MSEPNYTRCEVVGDLPIVDADSGADMVKGQVVLLDPARTNIAALVEAGAVKVLPAAKKAS